MEPLAAAGKGRERHRRDEAELLLERHEEVDARRRRLRIRERRVHARAVLEPVPEVVRQEVEGDRHEDQDGVDGVLEHRARAPEQRRDQRGDLHSLWWQRLMSD